MRMLNCEDIVFEARFGDLYLKFYTLFFALPFVLYNPLQVFCHFIAEKNSKIAEKNKVFCVFYIRNTQIFEKTLLP